MIGVSTATGVTALAEILPKARAHNPFFKGRSFAAKQIPISRPVFARLGFNPNRWIIGIRVLHMTRKTFDQLAAHVGIKPGEMEGFYEPGNGTTQRYVVLTEDATNLTLIHELLHDIFHGGGISVSDREQFIKDVLFLYRLSINKDYPQHHKNRKFFERVAELCARKYPLNEIKPAFGRGRPEHEAGFLIFASECFAYAGEFLADRDKAAFKEIPAEILSRMSGLRVFMRNMPRNLG